MFPEHGNAVVVTGFLTARSDTEHGHAALNGYAFLLSFIFQSFSRSRSFNPWGSCVFDVPVIVTVLKIFILDNQDILSTC